MMDEFSALTVASYSAQALTADQRRDVESLHLLGLFGETGSLLSEAKKKHRDRASYRGYAGAVVEELGDVLWYLNAVAAKRGLRLDGIAADLGRHDQDGRCVGRPGLTFASLQPAIMRPQTDPNPAFDKTRLRLAGEVGLLVSDESAGRLANNRPAVAARLAAILCMLVEAANEAGVTLEAAAVKNLGKIFDRWPRERTYPEPLDAGADAAEMLPRDLYVDVFERRVRGQTYVFQRCNGITIGDRLTDNAMAPDDYRFHDVFHYAYAAALTWSPVVRSLFRVKRKSDPKLDEAQDGARATIIEEGVATWIFGRAMELDFFAGMNPGDLPFDLLKHVRQFVAGYEVEQCPLWLWEEAILEGYAAFRFLREHRRGRVHLDMAKRRLDIEPLP
jgi:NTP pyrophosphatase (non-canonical NTP hydrolase)